MIKDKDRSGYFGASDSHFITGRWDTMTFKNWWLVKLGILKDDIITKAMRVGNAYEHKILNAYSKFKDIPIEKDGQIILEDIDLRVNYDGWCGNKIFEVKTYSQDKFITQPNYVKQVNVEMFAWNENHWGEEAEGYILAYHVDKNIEYLNYFEEVVPERIWRIPIEYDEDYIEEYLANLYVLCDCLEAGVMPNENDRPNRNKYKGKKKSTR